MRFLDLLRLVLGNLGRTRGRVALTAVGVVIGTAAVVILISLASGLQKNAHEQLYGIGELTQIQVWPGAGEASEGGRGVAMEIAPQGGGGGGGGVGGPKLLTNAVLDELRAIPGVVAVIPRDNFYGGVVIKCGRLEGSVSVIGVGTASLADLNLKAAQGTLELRKGTMIVGALVNRNFYDPHLRPGQNPPEPPDLYNQSVTLVISRWDQNGNETRRMLPYRVTGVLTETRGESDWSVYLSLDEVKALNEWVTGQRINYNKNGYGQVTVQVADARLALDVADQITQMGFQAYTPQSFVQGINNFYLVLQIIFGGVGAIALLVAAIGIANTLTMSILERTREIGLMKAVGATNRDVLSIFLGEAAGIGFLGGLGGVLIGWLAGQGLNVLALVYLTQQTASQGGMPPSVAVYTPPWLPLSALLFSTLVGMVSGLFPALRAATLTPVTALKYE
jgi:putative ABC transport system permease protein